MSLRLLNLGNVLRFYPAHYPPDTRGNKGYTDPRTGGHMQDEHNLL